MKLQSWGRFPTMDSTVYTPASLPEMRGLLQSQSSFNGIARGLGRSYGDSALADQVVRSTRLDHFLGFNPETGLLRCSAGTSLADILRHFAPQGWFLPVLPGTRFVTVGGAIASDVHGKNHHLDGTFGAHVDSLRLMLANGDIVECSRISNPRLFHATCGGMGLTGIIVDATLHLVRVPGSAVMQKTLRAESLEDVMALFEANAESTYSVAWIDCLARGSAMGRSLLYLGDHAHDNRFSAPRQGRLTVPVSAPSLLLNRHTMHLFNSLYFKRPIKASERIEPGSYFFPLDGISNWNRLYGKKVFLQYPFVVPTQGAQQAIAKVLQRTSTAGKGSFLSVLKKFGAGNNNLLSFPMHGYTLAMDFKWERNLFPLLDELDAIVLDHGGRLYLAKDARMSEQSFKRGYPRWEEFASIRAEYQADTRFNSLQSRRLGL